MHDRSTAIVLLAGGEARRFPGKLERPIDGEPMILRCYRNLRATALPIYVACKGEFSRDVDAQLDAPRLIDRDPRGGPLRAFASACGAIDAERCFAVAADQPRLDASVLRRLLAAWRRGDEAVVPIHDGRIEPLAALYDRAAVVREDPGLRRGGRAAMHDLVGAVAARFVPIESEYFYNVNRPGDLAGAAAGK
ncbi:MAG TPA: molybdenum cofactor guanylyltransferase [Candidatus Cybelea sp.]